MVITQKVSEGDLTDTVNVDSKDEIAQLGNSFNKMIESLGDVISRNI
ncbi:MAG: HAMP domain-containing protein [Clostridia bacterium]|nr:HAMP domain-containing protein [Clostridia bacterium]